MTVRLMSIVEATTVTGPVKPLLMFSALIRNGFGEREAVRHVVVSTRRPPLLADPAGDALRTQVLEIGATFVAVAERHPFDPRVITGLRSAIRDASPDVIETHDSKSHFMLFLLRQRHSQLRRIGWVAYHHGYTRTSWKVRLYQQLDRLSLRQADRVVTLCEPFARQLSRRGVSAAKLEIIKNFVPPTAAPSGEALLAARAALGIGPTERVIICIGRLSREKAQADLLEAFAKVSSNPGAPPLRLVLVGDGPERHRLESMAARIAPRVIFTGHLRDPWPLLNAADIFALPSHSEGSPLVLFEAMAARRPIVATRVGGIPETLTDGLDAVLVPPRDPAALAAALLRLAADDALRQRLGAAAGRALAEYSPDAYASRVLRIYDSVLT